jgi:hypothetical protein
MVTNDQWYRYRYERDQLADRILALLSDVSAPTSEVRPENEADHR